MAGPTDLGKAHVKVELSDAIPNVVRDPSMLPHDFTWSVALNFSGMDSLQSSYGIIPLVHKKPDGQALSACVIPRPTYEPVENFYSGMVLSEQTKYQDVFWTETKWEKAPEFFRLAVGKEQDGAGAARKSGDPVALLPPSTTEGVFLSWLEPVSREKFLMDQYDKQPIHYKGEGWVDPKAPTTPGKPAAAGAGGAAAANPDDIKVPETVAFLEQAEAAPGVWWSVETQPFKKKNWPFWMTIRPKALSTNEDDEKPTAPTLSIKLVDTQSAESHRASRQEAHVCYAELFISGDSDTASLCYKAKTTGKPTPNVQDSPAQNQPVEGKTSGSGSKNGSREIFYKMSDVSLPSVVGALKNLQEIRVGFLPLLGRLCIYVNPQEYAFVEFSGEDGSFIQFEMPSSSVMMAGYNCRASVNVSPMRFYTHSWFVVPGMDVEVVEGYRFPLKDSAGLKAGELGDGNLICSAVGLELQQEAGAKRKYGASFSEYREVLLDAKSEKEAKERRANSAIFVNKPNPVLGVLTPWGLIHLVRSNPVSGVSKEGFWFCYFHPEDFYKDNYDAQGNLVSRDTIDMFIKPGIPVHTGVLEERVGFPAFYQIQARAPMSKKNPPPSRDQTVNVTDDIVDFSLDFALDAPRPSAILKTGSLRVFNTQGKYSELLAKARGVKIWMKWSTKALSDTESDFGSPDGITFVDEDLVFTGIALARESNNVPGEQYVSFELVDHWRVLESMQIRNSPLYDGYEVSSVVQNIVERAGIHFVNDVIYSRPAQGGPKYTYLGTGTVYNKALFRFSTETTLKDCAFETIKASEVYMYFDAEGILRLAPVPGGFLFGKTAYGWDAEVYETYYQLLDGLPSLPPVEPHQIILDGLQYTSTLGSSIYNSFQIWTVDRDTGSIAISKASNKASLLNPDSIGYLGFIREIRIQRPDLGHKDAATKFAQMVKQMYGKPGFEIQFNTIGHIPKFRCGQFIRLSGNSEVFPGEDLFKRKWRVTSIKHAYTAAQNEWKTTIGAYQVEPGKYTFNPNDPNSKPSNPPGG